MVEVLWYFLIIIVPIIPISVCYYVEFTQRYNKLMGLYYFVKQRHLCFVMSKQPIEHLLVKTKLLSMTLLHCVIPNSNTH